MRALITGASSGIGLEFARLLAADGHELVLVARRQGLLDQLASELGNARVIVADLGDRDDIASLFSRVPVVDILVNNAGFADYGPFVERELSRQLAMIDLNARALTELSHHYLAGMLERGHGRILNVASLAAFQPGPLMAVYYATKAYVLSFSEALSEEARNSGVTITALCPGSTESGFRQAANLETSRNFDRRRLPTSAAVAAAGYQAMQEGKPVVVVGSLNRVAATLVRFIPRAVVRRFVHKMQLPR